MKDIKFILIILLMFFGGGIMEQINDYDYNVNNTGIMYQENDNIVLNEINRTYDYNINYNLDESYLHYFPIKKSGLLDKDNSKNLAVPNLTGKDYLGNGFYRLYNNSGFIIDYNIHNGYYIYNGTSQAVNILLGYFNVLEQSDFTMKLYYVSGSVSDFERPRISFTSTTEYIRGTYIDTLTSQLNLSQETFRTQPGIALYNNFTFKLQIEKGDTATSYQIPNIPSFKIDFKGSNQVEYINPYKEQLIKINDINNVNNIEFELLNTKNSVVYNWNITTNPNMPFVKFYNDETKLLYDFTDIDEINKIGNNLFGKRSKGITAFNSALDLVNTFYQGFQKLFNNEVIDTIGDYLRYLRLGINLPLELIRRR